MKSFDDSDLLNFVNRAHNLHYELIAELSGGYQSGAFLIRGSAANKAALKWSRNKSWSRQVERVASLIPFARAMSWPAPAWLAWRHFFWISVPDSRAGNR